MTMPLAGAIKPVSSQLRLALQAKIDQKTKPIGALGQLEDLALRTGLILNSLSPQLHKPAIMVFAGDHGIAEAGVSAYPQSVTAQMVSNFMSGGAAISVFARQHRLALLIVDAGIKGDISPPVTDQGTNPAQFIDAKIARGTRDFRLGPAMTEQECLKALTTGAELVAQQFKDGCNCIGFGEMGIGNTSAASLLMHRLTGISLNQCVGSGTGLNSLQFQAKQVILRQAADFHAMATEPRAVLAAFGGFEIAMMTGAYMKAAELGMLIMVDGFIASAALLVATKLAPNVLDYCVFSHVSSEHGHKSLLAYLQARPLLNLGLRLGEGSGIALAYPLLQSAVVFLNEMASFSDAGVDQKMVC